MGIMRMPPPVWEAPERARVLLNLDADLTQRPPLVD
jgi:hypothetical protein